MVSSIKSALILLPFLSVTLHESGTRNALLGPWLNNTEVYLTPFISTQNHTIAGWLFIMYYSEKKQFDVLF